MIQLKPEAIYTMREAAKLLGVCERTLYRAALKIGKDKRPIHKVFFSAGDLKKIMGVS